jgi:hypothetical protein
MLLNSDLFLSLPNICACIDSDRPDISNARVFFVCINIGLFPFPVCCLAPLYAGAGYTVNY